MPATLTVSPARIIAKLVVDLGYGVDPDPRDPAQWSVFATGEPSSPDEVITVRGTAGHDEGVTMVDSELQEWFGVQVRVRSLTDESGWVKARAIGVALQTQNDVVVTMDDGRQYLVGSCHQRGPVFPLGRMDQVSDRHLFTVNFEASISALPQ
jgi:hypothetical protein